MLHHHPVLLGGELAGLLEDVIGRPDLPDVVEERSPVEIAPRHRVEVELVTDENGGGVHALRMPARVRILGVHGGDETAHGRLEDTARLLGDRIESGAGVRERERALDQGVEARDATRGDDGEEAPAGDDAEGLPVRTEMRVAGRELGLHLGVAAHVHGRGLAATAEAGGGGRDMEARRMGDPPEETGAGAFGRAAQHLVDRIGGRGG